MCSESSASLPFGGRPCVRRTPASTVAIWSVVTIKWQAALEQSSSECGETAFDRGDRTRLAARARRAGGHSRYVEADRLGIRERSRLKPCREAPPEIVAPISPVGARSVLRRCSARVIARNARQRLEPRGQERGVGRLAKSQLLRAIREPSCGQL